VTVGLFKRKCTGGKETTNSGAEHFQVSDKPGGPKIKTSEKDRRNRGKKGGATGRG